MKTIFQMRDPLPAGRRPPTSVSRPASCGLRPAACRSRGGFTLLELLVVVSIMIMITTITLVNVFGMMRGASYAAISTGITNALLLGRQRACMDNKPVYFYLLNATDYVLREPIGTINKADNTTLYDYYGDASGLSNAVIANMTDGTASTVTVVVLNKNPVEWKLFIGAVGTWNPSGGDQYGVEVFGQQKLPKGFSFTTPVPTPSLSCNARSVIFQSDGSVDTINGLSAFTITESNTTKTVTFTIAPSGKIDQK